MPSMKIASTGNISAVHHATWCRRFLPGVIIAAFAALLTCATSFAAPAVSVTNARIRLLPGDLPLAGYFDFVNHGKRPVTLTAASSPAFRMVHLHRSFEQDGKSMMVPAGNIDIQPGAALHFAPGGYHLMLMDRVKPLKVGDKVPMTLRFSDRRALRVMFEVKGVETQ